MTGSPTVFLFFAVFFSLYGLINYWVGRSGWLSLGKYITGLSKEAYWLLYWLLVGAYPLARIGDAWLPAEVNRWLTIIGAHWLGALYYLVLLLILIKIFQGVNRFVPLIPRSWTDKPKAPVYVGAAAVSAVAILLLYGAWNAMNPIVQSYQVTIPKKAGNLQSLRVVAVSDLHLGIIIHNQRLEKMVQMVNSLDPDIVLLPGDVIDENPGPFVEQDMKSTFQRLKTKSGVYASMGNHEYIGRHHDEIKKLLQEAGVHVLVDEYIKVADSFYVIGRDDLSSSRFLGRPRQEFSKVMNGIERKYPLLLMDHQPQTLDESKEQGIDLQLSGHTHRGQLFPNQLITKRLFEIDWGYLRKDDFQVIVSSGFGTWGPPFRIGNTPEVVEVLIHFQP